MFVIQELGATHTQNWYDEVSSFDFSNPGFSMETGHFTQLVWKASRKVGFGLGDDSSSTSFVGVANYDPAGNSGDYEGNVSVPK
jgi:hypothetical protein